MIQQTYRMPRVISLAFETWAFLHDKRAKSLNLIPPCPSSRYTLHYENVIQSDSVVLCGFHSFLVGLMLDRSASACRTGALKLKVYNEQTSTKPMRSIDLDHLRC